LSKRSADMILLIYLSLKNLFRPSSYKAFSQYWGAKLESYIYQSYAFQPKQNNRS